MYRPPNFKNPYPKKEEIYDRESNEERYITSTEHIAYELGADALLEGLLVGAWECIPDNQWYLLIKWEHPDNAILASNEVKIRVYPERKGKLVFIPEE